jgi:hypothetical protein
MDPRTEKIITTFQDSWKEIEKEYDDLINNYEGWERYVPVKSFILDFIQKGEDKCFRAGRSLSTLTISRSVDGGLREDQKFVSIEALHHNDYEIKLREPLKTYREYRITSLDDPKLHKLPKTLKETLVD